MAAPNWAEATKGQSASLMYCACNHMGVYVRTTMADAWKCRLCKKGWPSGTRIVLGVNGALPEPQLERAA